MKIAARAMTAIGLLLIGGLSCGDESESDRVGIASNCTKDTDCQEVGDFQLTCLTVFKGGYCGWQGCTQDGECPTGSVCIAEGGVNYCFRACVEKPECNLHRAVESEANCVSSVDRVGASTTKVCVPPSGA